MQRRLFLTSLFAALAVTPARASGPVRHTASGCVRNGQFTTSRGTTTYTYKVRDRAPDRAFDLSPYEGRRVMMTGNLLPGDYFFPTGPIQILGKCR